ncbi:MAG: PfkB family carbohydrate kinase [Anaerolineae bacterium]
MSQIDYLVAGHVCADVTPDGLVMGGTAAYSAKTAQVLGCRTAVLTSTAADYQLCDALTGIAICRVEAENTTTFENVYTPQGRQQGIHAVADRLTAEHVPEAWRRASIVHLGPIANEVDPEIIGAFTNSTIGFTPQGWMRCWDEDGRVFAREWPAAPRLLPRAAVVVLSKEDLLNDEMLPLYRRWSKLLVLTQGRAGCTVFFGDDERHFPAPRVKEVEPTGAGDIFAAAFLVRLYQTAGNPWEAARFANKIAAQSVTQAGIDGKIAAIKRLLSRNEA